MPDDDGDDLGINYYHRNIFADDGDDLGINYYHRNIFADNFAVCVFLRV